VKASSIASGVYLTDRQVLTDPVLAKISGIGKPKIYFRGCIRETPENKRFRPLADWLSRFALC